MLAPLIHVHLHVLVTAVLSSAMLSMSLPLQYISMLQHVFKAISK